MICLEEYGTNNSEGGIIERPVRLPCNHVFGSQCIATWLSPIQGANNSCPYCRRTLFEVASHVGAPEPVHMLADENWDDTFDLFRLQGHSFNEEAWRLAIAFTSVEDEDGLARARTIMTQEYGLDWEQMGEAESEEWEQMGEAESEEWEQMGEAESEEWE